MNKANYIWPNWNAPKNVMALTTTRHAPGVSPMPFECCNLGTNTADSAEHVMRNRELLQQDLALKHAPIWLTQVHGDVIYQATHVTSSSPIADACFTTEKNLVCSVLTADCLPVLLTDNDASFVAALHCGWRGLHQDLIAKTLALAPHPERVIAWIGPGISQQHYQVDAGFYQNFCDKNSDFPAFFQRVNNSYHANLPGIAEYQLRQAGVTAIYQSDLCSFANPHCYSYRRDGKQSGRMASLITINSSNRYQRP